MIQFVISKYRGAFLSIAVAAACFISGYLAGSYQTAQAAANRIFELRIYTANEGKIEALHNRFREHTLRLFEKHGMTSIGYWEPLDAPRAGNQLIYILAHPSREAAEQAWQAFRNDPEWQRVRAESEREGRLVQSIERVLMKPTDYSPLK